MEKASFANQKKLILQKIFDILDAVTDFVATFLFLS